MSQDPRVGKAVSDVKRWVAACIGLGLLGFGLLMLTYCEEEQHGRDIEELKRRLRELESSKE